MNADYDAIALAERRARQLRLATRISVGGTGLILVLLLSGAAHWLAVAFG